MRLIDANALIREAKRRSEVYKTRGLSKAIADMVQDMTIYAPHPYEMRWIPCSERMPSDENKVLCCTQTKARTKNVVLGYYADGKWRCGMNSNVVAWMPLPEVYSGSEQE